MWDERTTPPALNTPPQRGRTCLRDARATHSVRARILARHQPEIRLDGVRGWKATDLIERRDESPRLSTCTDGNSIRQETGLTIRASRRLVLAASPRRQRADQRDRHDADLVPAPHRGIRDGKRLGAGLDDH